MSERISLTWLLNQRQLALRTVVPAQVSFTEIQPTELADPSEFLPPGAVVLLVGLAFETAPENFHDYVTRLRAADVAAIGFGTGLVFDRIPQQLIDAATTAGIALFEVPLDTPFLSLTTIVREELTQRAQREQTQQLDYQDALTVAVIKGGVEGLVSTLGTQLKAAVAVANDDGTIVASVSAGTLDARVTVVNAVARGRLRTSAFSQQGQFHLIQRTSFRHVIVVTAPRPYSDLARKLIRYSAGLVDTVLRAPAELRENHTRLNELGLSLLLGLGGSDDFLDKVFSFAADNDGLVRPVVVYSDNQRLLKRASAVVDRSLADIGRAYFRLFLSDNALVVVLNGSQETTSIPTLFADSLSMVRVAIGLPVAWRALTGETVDLLLTEAMSADLGAVVVPRDHGLKWLRGSVVKRALDQRSTETLDRLAEHDRQNGTELAATLSAFLRSGSHMAKAATMLGIHRHTLRNRLKKIEMICEVNLANPVVCAELLLVTITRS